MKKTYMKLLAFLGLVLIVNFSLHYSYKILIFNQTDNGRKEKQLNGYKGRLKYLFLGDSHSQNAIDPSIIGNSFNFSSSNENYIQTYYKLKAVANSLHRKPEFIVLPIDPSSFSSFRTVRFIDPSSLISFSDYFEIAKYDNDFSYIQTWLEQNFFMYSGKYTTISRYIAARQERNFSEMKLGFKGRDGNLTNRLDMQKVCEKKAEFYLGNQKYFDPILRDYFIKILEFCQSQGIGIYLMKMPMAKEYVEACNTFFSVEEYYTNIYSIAHRYSYLKHIFDFQDYFYGRQHFMRNPDHVNKEGAKLFSIMLADEFAKIEQDENTF